MDEIANKTGAHFDESHKLWLINCNADFSLVFETDSHFTIETSDVIAEVAPRTCVLLMNESQAGEDAQFVLGAPILSRYCIEFKVDADDVYLARIVERP